ncbi:MAG: MSCRAMM family protein [Candidatus Sumerlaeaceae bacterium]
MPNQKSPLLLIACAVACLFLLLVALRHEASKPVQDFSEERISDEEMEDSGGAGTSTKITRVAKIEAPPVVKNRKPPQEFLAQKVENFEAEQKRAFGDSFVGGKVRDDRNEGIPGARVLLYENDPNTTNPPLREATADQDGSFTLTQLHDGDRQFIVVARADGYAPEAQRVRIAGAPTELDITLVRPVTLGGKVLNAITSEPLAGVTVIHPNDNDEVFGVLGSINTGPGGTFVFEECHPGRVITRVSTPGFRTTTVRLRAPTTTATILLMPGGSTVRGVTVDRLTSKPQSGARVWLETDNSGGNRQFRDSKMSADDGKFEFKDLPAGSYRIYAIRGMRSERQEFELGDNETRDGISITLPADLFVSGKVVDANEGKVLPGVRIWYRAPSGNNSVLSDKDGLFAFDTMAVNSYTIQVHEKGYLPVLEKKTTGVVESITRRVPQNSSSDSFVLRLRPVPAITGIVTSRRREDSPKQPVWNADVSVDYLIGEDHEKIVTKSGPKGDFFVNLPIKRRGDAKIIAYKNNAIDAASIKVPSRKPIELNLKRNMLFGSLVLSDQSALDGIKVAVSHFLPEKSERPLVLHERDFYTGFGGRFSVPMPEKQKVQLTFFLPDSILIPKTYQTDNLLNRRSTFIYDPITNDVLLDSGGQARNRGRGPGQGQGQDRERGRPGNSDRGQGRPGNGDGGTRPGRDGRPGGGQGGGGGGGQKQNK